MSFSHYVYVGPYVEAPAIENWYTLVDEINEAMSRVLGEWGAAFNGVHIWIPNDGRREMDRDFGFEPRCQDDTIIPIAESDLAAEVAWLQEEYKSEIAILSQAYNHQLTFRWGILIYTV